MGGKGGKKKGGGGGGGGGGGSSNNGAMAAMMAAQAAQAAAAARAEAERQRQIKIQQENDAAAQQQNASLVTAQSRLGGLQASQKLQDAAAAQRQTLANTALGAGGGGFDINAARMQALGNVAGAGAAASMTPYAAGSAATNAAPSAAATPAMVAAANEQTGGTNMRVNQFALPSASGLRFGGG